MRVVFPPDIRAATEADIPAIMELVNIATEEGWQKPSVEKSKFQMLHCLRTGVFVVSVANGVVCGVFAGIVDQLWYTDEYHLREIALFVHPRHRKSSHARNLLTAAQDAAKSLGIPLVVSPHSTDRTNAKCRLIGRHLHKIGEIFVSE